MGIDWTELRKDGFYIIAKRNDDEGRIEKVKVFFSIDKKRYIVPRKLIISLLKLGKLTIKTATRKFGSINEYQEGDIVVLYDNEFITTKGRTNGQNG